MVDPSHALAEQLLHEDVSGIARWRKAGTLLSLLIWLGLVVLLSQVLYTPSRDQQNLLALQSLQPTSSFRFPQSTKQFLQLASTGHSLQPTQKSAWQARAGRLMLPAEAGPSHDAVAVAGAAQGDGPLEMQHIPVMGITRRDTALALASTLVMGVPGRGVAADSVSEVRLSDAKGTGSAGLRVEAGRFSESKDGGEAYGDARRAAGLSAQIEGAEEQAEAKQLKKEVCASWEGISASARRSLDKGQPKDLRDVKSLLELKLTTIKSDMRSLSKFATGGDIVEREGDNMFGQSIPKFSYGSGMFTLKPLPQRQEDIFARLNEVYAAVTAKDKDATMALKKLDEADAAYADWLKLLTEVGL